VTVGFAGVLAYNGVRNGWGWPVRLLAAPLLLFALLWWVDPLETWLGVGGRGWKSHTGHTLGDLRIDVERVDGGCAGESHWLRRGGGPGGREIHLDQTCDEFTIVAPDTVAVLCREFSEDTGDFEDVRGRTIRFDPVTLAIRSDTGENKVC